MVPFFNRNILLGVILGYSLTMVLKALLLARTGF